MFNAGISENIWVLFIDLYPSMFLYLFISSRNYFVDSLALLHRHAVLCASLFTHVWLFATTRIVTLQAPLSIGILRQEYWSGLPCSPPENLPNPGIEPRSPALQADSLPFEPPGKPNFNLNRWQIFPIKIYIIWHSQNCLRVSVFP